MQSVSQAGGHETLDQRTCQRGIETSGQRRSEPTLKKYDDKMETSEVQAERIRHQRSRGDSLAALQGRHIQITVDRVLRARGKLMTSKNGPADCLVAETLQCLPTETVYEVVY